MDPDRLAVNPTEFAAALKLLASPTRLQLLAAAKTPRTVRDLVVPPERASTHAGTTAISHQAVRKHLSRLQSLDLVRTSDGAAGTQYMVNHTRLFALAEAFGQLASQHRFADETRGDQTEVLSNNDADGAAPLRDAGPRLTVVHGACQGRVDPLTQPRRRNGGWGIGRLATNAVCLDYDPFVSRVHCTIRLADDHYVLEDHADAANRTRLNFQDLPRGGSHGLRAGDIIGVGRSLLAFSDH